MELVAKDKPKGFKEMVHEFEKQQWRGTTTYGIKVLKKIKKQLYELS